MLEALLRGMMKIVIDCHIILGPHTKNCEMHYRGEVLLLKDTLRNFQLAWA